MRSSSFSLFIISLFTLNSYFVKATINHKLSKKQSPQRLYRDFGLSPVLDANIVGDNDLSINAPNSFEKPFHFPASVGKYETDDSVGTNAQDLGHYAGYYKLTNTKGARWFYYFFKSAKNDRNGPVVVWLTGGPGCSSSIALFYENGPFKLTKNLSLVPNEYSWSKESNIIYIDQPTGTGFSYTTDEADIRHTSEEAGLDFYNFIQTFFEKHPEYQRNDFYIMGESYAGHFIPAFAAEIQKGNRNSKQGRNNIYINLKGISIGNGFTNPGPQYASYPVYAKTMNLINQAQYNSLNDFVSTCLHHCKDCAGNGSDLLPCLFAYEACEAIFNSILDLSTTI